MKKLVVLKVLIWLYVLAMILMDIIEISKVLKNVGGSMPTNSMIFLIIIKNLIPFIILVVIYTILVFIYKKRGVEINKDNNHKLKKTMSTLIHSRVLYVVLPILVILGFILSILLIQNQILYYPHYNEISNFNLSKNTEGRLEELFVDSNEGRYHGWVYKCSEEADTIVYFGGNAQTSDEWFEYIKNNSERELYFQYNYVMIDYPGYSISDGKPGYNSIISMADTTISYVLNDDYLGNNRIIIMGYSLGTGVASYVASNNSVDMLILLAPYNNMTEVFNSKMNVFYGPLKYLVRSPFSSDKYIGDIDASILIIASKNDEVIPFKLSEKLVDKNSKITICSLDNVTHTELLTNIKTKKIIKDFLDQN